MFYDQSYAQKTNFSHFSFFFQFWVSLLSISIIQHLCKTTRHSAFLGGARPKQLILLWIGIVLGSQALPLLIEDLAGRCDLLLTSVEKVSEQLIQVKQSLKLIV